MKKLAYAAAVLTCLTAVPATLTPAAAQGVTVGIGGEGPRVRVGDQDRGRRYGQSDRNCRNVKVRTRHPDGSVSVRTSRRCN